MAAGIEEGEQGIFGFRYRLLPEGRLVVWYRFGEHLEVGPVELEQADADELGRLIERASGLVTRASPYSPGEESESPSEEPEEVEDELRRTRTDPSALRRKRQLPPERT